MRRIIPVAVVVAVLAAVGTAAAQSSQRFEDVPSDAYFHDAVEWAVENGITTGCGDGTNFCPDDPLTRAHVVTFLHRALAPEYAASGIGGDEDPVVTDNVRLDPGYYSLSVNFELAPNTAWDDPDDFRDFYVWFGSKTTGWEVVNINDNWFPDTFFDVRIDKTDDYWFSVGLDSDFVWWAEIYERPLPEGVSFE